MMIIAMTIVRRGAGEPSEHYTNMYTSGSATFDSSSPRDERCGIGQQAILDTAVGRMALSPHEYQIALLQGVGHFFTYLSLEN